MQIPIFDMQSWIFFPVVMVLLVPILFIGNIEKKMLNEWRRKVIATYSLAAVIGALLFLVGQATIGLAVFSAMPLCHFHLWTALNRRFVRIHKRQPVNMGYNSVANPLYEPDRWYWFTLIMGISYLMIGLAIVVDTFCPYVLWKH